jgi:benzoate/toluate 1,2-dioxygenase alpha subunit
MSGVKTEDEGLFVVQHKHWHDVMRRAVTAEAQKA